MQVNKIFSKNKIHEVVLTGLLNLKRRQFPQNVPWWIILKQNNYIWLFYLLADGIASIMQYLMSYKLITDSLHPISVFPTYLNWTVRTLVKNLFSHMHIYVCIYAYICIYKYMEIKNEMLKNVVCNMYNYFYLTSSNEWLRTWHKSSA